METVWQQAKNALKEHTPTHVYKMWIEPVQFLKLTGENIVLSCPNNFLKKRVLENFGTMIHNEICRVGGDHLNFSLEVSRGNGKAVKHADKSPSAGGQQMLPKLGSRPQNGRMLRKDFTFDRFVVGKNCDFAYTAALSLASQKKPSQSALFLLSQTGMGKSHLAQAAGHFMGVPGTGGTSATIGRYLRYRRHSTRLCVVDPECSVFREYWKTRDCNCCRQVGSGVEGIGRPQVERSFLPDVVDHMISVPNHLSLAAIHFLEKVLGRRCGGSTGTNLIGAAVLISQMQASGQSGSVVSLICDGGELYRDTYYQPEWLARNGYDITPGLKALEHFWHSGQLSLDPVVTP